VCAKAQHSGLGRPEMPQRVNGSDPESPGDLLEVACRIAETPSDRILSRSFQWRMRRLAYAIASTLVGVVSNFTLAANPFPLGEMHVWTIAIVAVASFVALAAAIFFTLQSLPLRLYGSVSRGVAVGQCALSIARILVVPILSLATLIFSIALILWGHLIARDSYWYVASLPLVIWALAAGLQYMFSSDEAVLSASRRRRVASVRFTMWPLRTGAVTSGMLWVAAAFLAVGLWNMLASRSLGAAATSDAAHLPAAVAASAVLVLVGWAAGRSRVVETARRDLARAVNGAYVEAVLACRDGGAEAALEIAAALWALECELSERVDAHRVNRRGSSELIEVVRWLACTLVGGTPDKETVPHLSQFQALVPVDTSALSVEAVSFLASLRTAVVGPTPGPVRLRRRGHGSSGRRASGVARSARYRTALRR